MNAVEGRPRPKYSELVYNGFWFASEREAFQALVTETQRDVTGVVCLKLYKGNIIETRVAQNDIPGQNGDWRKDKGMVKTSQTRSTKPFCA